MKIVSLTELQDQQVSHNPSIKKRVMIAPGELGGLTNFSQAVFPIGEIAPVHQQKIWGKPFLSNLAKGKYE